MLLLLGPGILRAQLVGDGATRTLSNVTNAFSTDLIVGTNGAFTRLNLINAALLTNNGYAYVGFNAGANSNAVVLQDPNTRWLMSGSLVVGSSGSFNTLLITNGALMVSSNGTVGALFGASNNQVIVTGANATWNNGSLLSVGLLGSFNTLLISNGGTVSAARAAVGDIAGSPGNVLRLAGGSLIVPGGLRVNLGNTIAGSGAITGNVTNFGIIAPGNSLGNLSVNGGLSLGAGSAASFDIAGPVPASQHDTVTATGAVQFNGALNVSLLNGFTPAPGDTFALMTFASRTGTFTNAPNGAVVLTADQQRQFTVTYTATNLVAGNFQINSNALFRLTALTPSASQVTVKFQSTAGNRYQIQYCDALTNWIDATSPPITNAVNGITTWLDGGTNTGGLPLPGTRFYRARLWP